MRLFYYLIFLPLLAAYCAVFLVQERLFKETITDLTPIPSYQLLKATTGFLHQLTAEILFIKTAVFLGGVSSEVAPSSYAPVLAHNYRQITLLYPEFIDPYYYTQAYLPNIDNESTKAANEILSTGIVTYPNSIILRLFKGNNYFLYLDEPLAAANVFQEASKLSDAPPIFGHLAAILSAQGGNLYAAALSLQVMIKAEENEIVRKRYQGELEMFQQAIQVQAAVGRYYAAMGYYPNTLDALVPVYLASLPAFGTAFELVWESPQVKLRRPEPKKAGQIPLKK